MFSIGKMRKVIFDCWAGKISVEVFGKVKIVPQTSIAPSMTQ